MTADDAGYAMRELGEGDIAGVQRFFERNPEYFVAVNGEAPRPDEAKNEFADVPPAGMPYRVMTLLGFFDGDGALIGVATVVGDFIRPHVWHVGLFIVASALHGSGVAHALYRQLERWMVGQGALWLRLGVVQGNAKAERFWLRCGYVQVRERGPLAMGKRTNLLRVMAKPLAGGTIDEYLALVERDRPSAP
ncbi:MAG TPA: GNAT family N-acetyltransferase [Caldimonas sp.]|nr:GNAT family N-acetyltransferase [Caldimonas sp.]